MVTQLQRDIAGGATDVSSAIVRARVNQNPALRGQPINRILGLQPGFRFTVKFRSGFGVKDLTPRELVTGQISSQKVIRQLAPVRGVGEFRPSFPQRVSPAFARTQQREGTFAGRPRKETVVEKAEEKRRISSLKRFAAKSIPSRGKILAQRKAFFLAHGRLPPQESVLTQPQRLIFDLSRKGLSKPEIDLVLRKSTSKEFNVSTILPTTFEEASKKIETQKAIIDERVKLGLATEKQVGDFNNLVRNFNRKVSRQNAKALISLQRFERERVLAITEAQKEKFRDLTLGDIVPRELGGTGVSIIESGKAGANFLEEVALKGGAAYFIGIQKLIGIKLPKSAFTASGIPRGAQAFRPLGAILGAAMASFEVPRTGIAVLAQESFKNEIRRLNLLSQAGGRGKLFKDPSRVTINLPKKVVDSIERAAKIDLVVVSNPLTFIATGKNTITIVPRTAAEFGGFAFDGVLIAQLVRGVLKWTLAKAFRAGKPVSEFASLKISPKKISVNSFGNTKVKDIGRIKRAFNNTKDFFRPVGRSVRERASFEVDAFVGRQNTRLMVLNDKAEKFTKPLIRQLKVEKAVLNADVKNLVEPVNIYLRDLNNLRKGTTGSVRKLFTEQIKSTTDAFNNLRPHLRRKGDFNQFSKLKKLVESVKKFNLERKTFQIFAGRKIIKLGKGVKKRSEKVRDIVTKGKTLGEFSDKIGRKFGKIGIRFKKFKKQIPKSLEREFDNLNLQWSKLKKEISKHVEIVDSRPDRFSSKEVEKLIRNQISFDKKVKFIENKLSSFSKRLKKEFKGDLEVERQALKLIRKTIGEGIITLRSIPARLSVRGKKIIKPFIERKVKFLEGKRTSLIKRIRADTLSQKTRREIFRGIKLRNKEAIRLAKKTVEEAKRQRQRLKLTIEKRLAKIERRAIAEKKVTKRVRFRKKKILVGLKKKPKPPKKLRPDKEVTLSNNIRGTILRVKKVRGELKTFFERLSPAKQREFRPFFFSQSKKLSKLRESVLNKLTSKKLSVEEFNKTSRAVKGIDNEIISISKKIVQKDKNLEALEKSIVKGIKKRAKETGVNAKRILDKLAKEKQAGKDRISKLKGKTMGEKRLAVARQEVLLEGKNLNFLVKRRNNLLKEFRKRADSIKALDFGKQKAIRNKFRTEEILLRRKIATSKNIISEKKEFFRGLRLKRKINRFEAKQVGIKRLFKKRRTGAERRKGKLTPKQRARQKKLDELQAKLVLANRQASKIRDTIDFNKLSITGRKTAVDAVSNLRKARKSIVDELTRLVRTQNNIEKRILELGKRLDKTTNLDKRKRLSGRIFALEKSLDRIVNVEFNALNSKLSKVTFGKIGLHKQAVNELLKKFVKRGSRKKFRDKAFPRKFKEPKPGKGEKVVRRKDGLFQIVKVKTAIKQKPPKPGEVKPPRIRGAEETFAGARAKAIREQRARRIGVARAESRLRDARKGAVGKAKQALRTKPVGAILLARFLQGNKQKQVRVQKVSDLIRLSFAVRSAQRQLSELKQRQGLKLDVADRTALRERVDLRPRQLTLTTVLPRLKLREAEKQRLALRTRLREAQKLKLKQRLKLKKLPPIIVPLPGLKGVSFASIARLRGPFDVVVRVRGKLKKLNRVPLDGKTALGLGGFEADNRAIRSFGIVKGKGKVKKISVPAFNPRKFRKPKGNTKLQRFLLVEKIAFALDTKMEKKEITFKGLEALKKRRKKKKIKAKKAKKRRKKRKSKKR